MKPDAILKALLSYKRKEQEEPPKGYRNVKEWEKVWRKKKTATERYLKLAVERGILKRIKIRRYIDGRYMKIYYWG
jgi:Fic family protein